MGLPGRGPRWPLPCLCPPSPPPLPLREKTKLSVLGRPHGQSEGSWLGASLNLDLLRELSKGLGWRQLLPAPLGSLPPGLPPPVEATVEATPLVHLLQGPLLRDIHHLVRSPFITCLSGTCCVPGPGPLRASRVAVHEGVGRQPPGDAPPPQAPRLHLPGSSTQETGNSNGRIFSTKALSQTRFWLRSSGRDQYGAGKRALCRELSLKTDLAYDRLCTRWLLL